jgi:polar amino acid transport system permease protein
LKKKFQITFLDAAISLLLLIAAGYIFHRVHTRIQYNWNWGAIPQYLVRYDPESGSWVPNVLMKGLFNTLRLSVWGTLLAVFFGTVIGLFRVSRSLFKRLVGSTYVGLIRNIPPLVLIFVFYFFIGSQILQALGIEAFVQNLSGARAEALTFFFAPPSQFPAFLSALLALALFEGAYIAEIVRAGIASIEKGQWEASDALGLSRWQQMRHVILPQATRRILPPLAGQLISTVKDSAIVSLISIPDLAFQGMELMASTYLTFEIWITVALLYLTMTLTLSLAVQHLEKKIDSKAMIL